MRLCNGDWVGYEYGMELDGIDEVSRLLDTIGGDRKWEGVAMYYCRRCGAILPENLVGPHQAKRKDQS